MSFNDEDIVFFENQQNEDVPYELQNVTPKQIDSEFSITQDLFFSDTDKKMWQYDTNEIIQMYKDKNSTSGNLVNLIFRENILPNIIGNLTMMTELQISNCRLDEINILPPNLEKLICNNCNLKFISLLNFSPNITYIDLSKNEIELISDFEKLKKLK